MEPSLVPQSNRLRGGHLREILAFPGSTVVLFFRRCVRPSERVLTMVYCQSCGQQNPDNVETCTRCGANLYPASSEGKFKKRTKEEDECFGLPNGGAICGLILGVLIVIYGVSWLLGYDLSQIWSTTLGPTLVILVGLLIVAGAVYGFTRGKR